MQALGKFDLDEREIEGESKKESERNKIFIPLEAYRTPGINVLKWRKKWREVFLNSCEIHF